MKGTFSVLFLVVAGSVYSQTVMVKNSAPAGSSTPYDNYYDRQTQVTVAGRISGIGVSKPAPSMPNNVRLVLQTTGKKPSFLVVELGPRWYVNAQSARLKLGQHVKVTGSKITDNGEIKILASHVAFANHDVLTLRRLSGAPYWVSRTPPTSPDDVSPSEYVSEATRLAAVGTILANRTFDINGVSYAGYVVQTANGPANVLVNPPDFVSPVQSFNVGDNVRVFSSGYVPSTVQVGSNYVVASSMYGGDGTVIVGAGGIYFPGYRRW
jgi:hypothetical protein